MDVFDVSIGRVLQVGLVTRQPMSVAPVSDRHARRSENTRRSVVQNTKELSLLKFLTVCKRFNIDALHPRAFHMVLALLSKTESTIELFELVSRDGVSDPVILDMDVVGSISALHDEMMHSVSDWVALLGYMECAVSDADEQALLEDVHVRRFIQSLEVGGLQQIVQTGMSNILMCMVYTFPAQTQISQMLERFVLATCKESEQKDVEMRCLRAASHYMDAVSSGTAHMRSMAAVLATMRNRDVFTHDLRFVLQREESIRAISELTESPECSGRQSLRLVVQERIKEKMPVSTHTFESWRSQMQFGVTTSLHLQLLLYFVAAQTAEPDMGLVRDMYTSTILERVDRRNGTLDSLDQAALSRLIKTVRIYKHSIANLIDFRVQCLQGFSVKTRLSLSLAQVVQLYICCFQHKSVFEYVWKQVVPIMNHTITTSCERFRTSNVFDSSAVLRTLIDSNTIASAAAGPSDSGSSGAGAPGLPASASGSPTAP